MLEEFALLPCAGEPAEAVWPELPASWRAARRFAVSPRPNMTFTKTVAVPRLGRSKRAQVVRFEAEQAIPRPLAEVVWDWAAARAGDARVELVAMKREAAFAWCDAAERAGGHLEAIVARSTALARALRYNYPEVEGDAVVVECDGATALLVRSGAGTPLARLVGLPVREAVETGPAVAGDGEEGLRLRRLAAEIARLAEPEEGEAPAGVSTVFLAGTDAPPREEMERALGGAARVEWFDGLRRVKIGPRARGAEAVAHQLGSVVGVMLAAGDAAAPNLLPAERRREILFRRRRWIWLGLAAGVAVVCGGAAGWLRYAVAQGQREVAAYESRLAPWRSAQAEVQARRRANEADRQMLQTLQQLETARTRWLVLLAGLERCVGQEDGLRLDTLEALPMSGGAAPTGWFGHPPERAEKLQGVRLAVTGRAPTPAAGGRSGLEVVRGFLREAASLEPVAAIEAERFDDGEPGCLRFGCVLVLKAEERQ